MSVAAGKENRTPPSVFALLVAVLFLTASVVTAGAMKPRRNTVYVEYNKRRLVLYHNEESDCDIVAGKSNVFHALNMLNVTLDTTADATAASGPGHHGGSGRGAAGVALVGRASMRQLIGACERIQARLWEAGQHRHDVWDRRDGPLPPTPPQALDPIPSGWTKNTSPLRGLLIFPGTKWCGAGDVADSYNDLGYHAESDKCCRQHDLCLTFTGEYIAPGQCKNGLCNPSPFYRSPCRCDLQLGSCLRSARNRIANLIGRTFFNVAGMSCFKYEYPITRCAEYFQPHKSRLPPWVLSMTKVNENPEGPRCKAYEYDLTQPKMWQFFETVYEETNNWMMTTENPGRAFAAAGRKTLPFFQKLLVDFISLVLEPLD